MNTDKYLRQLSVEFPTMRAAAAEIINLSSSLNLPKGTEHFISDIHGAYDSFNHVLKNGSGSISKKIEDEFGSSLSAQQKKMLATLIYYPKERLEIIERNVPDFGRWCKWVILQLIRITRRMASKYNRTKLRRAVQYSEYEYIVEELLTEKEEVADKNAYYNEIIDAIIETDSAKHYIIVFCRLIQHLAIDRLHVIGDIYDRGSEADMVMETLSHYHSVDVQWGNHDVEWMGAACGSLICIASVIRICARYGNLSTLENGYGINLIPLVTHAISRYGDDPCACFEVTEEGDDDPVVSTKVHKAITVILLKLEGQLSMRRPEFNMQGRMLLDKINYENGTVKIDGKEYELLDKNFPTIDRNNPYALTKEEEKVCEKLRQAFLSSEKLQRHIEFLYTRGSMYRIYNGNLLYHGCVPLTKDGSFKSATIKNKKVCGKELFDTLEHWARIARYSHDVEEKEYGLDVMYFMWSNPLSPLFGKEKMATFERYFIADKSVQEEEKNSYYTLYNDEKTVMKIFKEFNLDYEKGHIINGHVPVKLKEGQSPIHCGGKVIIIDGGFSKCYQKVTGIAGYTLVSDSRYLKLVAHEPFVSTAEAIMGEADIRSVTEIISHADGRLRVADTDKGRDMLERIQDLKDLINAYKSGAIREHQA